MDNYTASNRKCPLCTTFHPFPGWRLQVQVEFDPPVGNKAAVAICDNSIYGLYKLRNPNRVRFVA